MLMTERVCRHWSHVDNTIGDSRYSNIFLRIFATAELNRMHIHTIYWNGIAMEWRERVLIAVGRNDRNDRRRQKNSAEHQHTTHTTCTCISKIAIRMLNQPSCHTTHFHHFYFRVLPVQGLRHSLTQTLRTNRLSSSSPPFAATQP